MPAQLLPPFSSCERLSEGRRGRDGWLAFAGRNARPRLTPGRSRRQGTRRPPLAEAIEGAFQDWICGVLARPKRSAMIAGARAQSSNFTRLVERDRDRVAWIE